MSQVDSRTIINVFFIIVTIIIGVYVIFLFSNIETEVNNTHISQRECIIRKINQITTSSDFDQLLINLIDFTKKIEVNKITYEYTPLYFDVNYNYNISGSNNLKIYPFGIKSKSSKNGVSTLVKNNCIMECNNLPANKDIKICVDLCENISKNIREC